MQQARSLASQLTSTGASLYAFMAREVDLRDARNEAIGRQLDSEWVEKCLENARDAIRDEIAKTENALVNITADEGTLDGKIEKRRNELERNQKRLTTLQVNSACLTLNSTCVFGAKLTQILLVGQTSLYGGI